MPVTFDLRGEVGVITLASPERRNVLSRDIVTGVLEILDGVQAKTARALVITGKGSAFCAGANIGDLLGAGWMEERSDGPSPVELFEALTRHRRVVVAAVNGLALGGGFELSLYCDFVFAAEKAVFALPELGLGVIPNTGLPRLCNLIGTRRALELVVSRRKLPAEEAFSLGLVNRIVADSNIVEAAVEFAASTVANVPPAALAEVKRCAWRAEAVDWQEARAALLRLPPAEWKEGLGAFVERRSPDYEQFWKSHA
ncbi:MAG: enoyl-CoA hydratase/isomerase family protein [Rhizobiales bacterium]|nr:enoyl-CoA hydratase/isomerase family protein [Hyphomicrobiales bacterium]